MNRWHRPVIPKRFVLVFGTFLLSVLLYVDRACISAAKDPVCRDLGLSKTEFSHVISAFALGYALCQTPAGWLADRLGPRRVLTAVVVLWSLFTGLTAATYRYITLLLARLFFGAGEAGAFPGIARATYSWIPLAERGLVQGINFSGSRLGAALALPLVAWMIDEMGWRRSFVVLMLVGFAWAAFWYFWFRDDPSEHPRISQKELDHIISTRQRASPGEEARRGLSPRTLLRSSNVWLISAQYFCSNFTFFFCLSWLHPHLKERFDLDSFEAALYSAVPLICGALGNWFSGWLVDALFRNNLWILSRRIPAMLGFLLAATGLVASVFAESPFSCGVWLSVAIFGADMTLSPSWSFCIDIGRHNSGVVSGTMNMAGNIGAFITALAFAYLEETTDSYVPYFFTGAALNVLALWLWMFVRPDRPLEEK